MKRKFLCLTLFSILFISTMVPSVHGLDIWGVNKGDTRYYVFNKQYTGNVTGSSEFPVLQYQVLEHMDTDGTDYTDVYYRVSTVTGALPTETFIPRVESYFTVYALGSIEYTFFILSGYNAIEDLFSIGDGGGFLLPILGNQTFSITPFILPWGLNWSHASLQINSTAGYSCYFEGNYLIINNTDTDLTDIHNGMLYNVTKSIIWDKTTGWLVSVKVNQIYQYGLYEVTGEIGSQATKPSIGTAGVIGFNDILWILAVCVCGAAALISVAIYYKIKKRK